MHRICDYLEVPLNEIKPRVNYAFLYGVGCHSKRTHMSGDDDTTPNYDALCEACAEGRQTLDHQITSLQRIDEKAIQILRANILFIGLILTALSFVVQSPMDISRFINFHTVFGAFLLLGSCISAGITFLVTEYEPGIGAAAINTTVNDGLTEKQLYTRLANGYSDWVEYNESALQLNGLIATATILFVINAIALLTTGAIIGALGKSGTTTSNGLFGLLLVLLGTLSFIVYKFDLWVQTHYVLKKEENGR